MRINALLIKAVNYTGSLAFEYYTLKMKFERDILHFIYFNIIM